MLRPFMHRFIKHWERMSRLHLQGTSRYPISSIHPLQTRPDLELIVELALLFIDLCRLMLTPHMATAFTCAPRNMYRGQTILHEPQSFILICLLMFQKTLRIHKLLLKWLQTRKCRIYAAMINMSSLLKKDCNMRCKAVPRSTSFFSWI